MKRTLFIIISICIFTIFQIATAEAALTLNTSGIRVDRPRLLLDSADVQRIRTAITTYSKTEYTSIKSYVDSRIKSVSAVNLPADSMYRQITMATAFVALVSNSSTYITAATQYALALAAVAPSTGNDTAWRGRLEALSYCYDWLYPTLTSANKATIKNSIIGHIKQVLYMSDDPNFTGGHSRYGNVTLMAAAIALSGITVSGVDIPALIKKEHSHWETGYNPFQSYAGIDGGYYMGWRYGAGYTTVLPYLLWEKATGEVWCADWRSQQSSFYLYGLRGDKSWPRLGDSWNSVLYDENIVAIMAVASGKFKDQYAEWFMQTYMPKPYGMDNIIRIIHRDPSVAPKAPESLPHAKLFRNSDILVARDRWDAATTQLIFKSSAVYTMNHHHKDQNHIELSYKGSLLIDSGEYDSYASNHWQNYYDRTIAHNSMVVFDPTQVMKYCGVPISNDGGQVFANYTVSPIGHEPHTYTEAITDKYSFAGVTNFGILNNVTWSRGDASKAYDPNVVQTYVRDVLMLNTLPGRVHPVILLLDRINLNKVLKPTILFHMNEQPSISGRYFSFGNPGGGLLHADVLYPTNAVLTNVGGAGKEFWVNGVNYPPSNDYSKSSCDPGFLSSGSRSQPSRQPGHVYDPARGGRQDRPERTRCHQNHYWRRLCRGIDRSDTDFDLLFGFAAHFLDTLFLGFFRGDQGLYGRSGRNRGY